MQCPAGAPAHARSILNNPQPNAEIQPHHILWGSLLTTTLVGVCIAIQCFASQDLKGTLEGQVMVAVSLMAAYMSLVIGIMDFSVY